MHEYAIVDTMVRQLLDQLRQQGAERVVEVRFRRGSTFMEEPLRQGFEALAAGTPLEGARLVIETVNLEYRCECGHAQVVTNDDLIGHMFVCPQCGVVREVRDAHDLELMEVVVEDAAPPRNDD
ncbi:MAG: hydrogenase/urease maturation nickel metallochaperone HypA [Candidatus Sumerlaeaceae bacterium]|nr:hydrogenase/urease maturation nickel metallochaperone HypA [Candidatus Sumerlaeaceae bacterium]